MRQRSRKGFIREMVCKAGPGWAVLGEQWLGGAVAVEGVVGRGAHRHHQGVPRGLVEL